MDKQLLSTGLNIILTVILYISHQQKNKISDQLTKLLIEKKIPKKELKDIDKNNKINAIKSINQKYKLGIKNSTKIFESLD